MLLLDRYEVIRSLGSGGFGETFLAKDTHLPSGRPCAIKRLKLEDRDPEIQRLAKERFYREAAVLEELGRGSEQIPSLYQYLESEGGFYLVQEWIDGVTLKEKVRLEGRLNESSVIEILIGVLKVLDYMHGEGIIHRDIKPENIILRSRDGLPILIDFGAVKEELKTVSLSNKGSRSIAIGTPGYMPNEQVGGRPVSSSDLYALGLTAVFLLTGKNPLDLFFDSTTSKFAWRNEVLNVSSEFGDILDKAIEDEAKNRYSTAKEMLETLVIYQSGGAVSEDNNSDIIPIQKNSSQNLSIARKIRRINDDLELLQDDYDSLTEKIEVIAKRLKTVIDVEEEEKLKKRRKQIEEERREVRDKIEEFEREKELLERQ